MNYLTITNKRMTHNKRSHIVIDGRTLCKVENNTKRASELTTEPVGPICKICQSIKDRQTTKG